MWEPGFMLVKHYGPWVIGFIITAWTISTVTCKEEQPPKRNRKV